MNKRKEWLVVLPEKTYEVDTYEEAYEWAKAYAFACGRPCDIASMIRPNN